MYTDVNFTQNVIAWGHNVSAPLKGCMLTKRKHAFPQHRTRGDCHANLCVPVTGPDDLTHILQSKFSFFFFCETSTQRPVTMSFSVTVSLCLHLIKFYVCVFLQTQFVQMVSFQAIRLNQGQPKRHPLGLRPRLPPFTTLTFPIPGLIFF